MKYIESQYLNRSAFVQIDSEFGLNPAIRALSGLDVPYDAEVRGQRSDVRGQTTEDGDGRSTRGRGEKGRGFEGKSR